jgi:hypothetical protein
MLHNMSQRYHEPGMFVVVGDHTYTGQGSMYVLATCAVGAQR